MVPQESSIGQETGRELPFVWFPITGVLPKTTVVEVMKRNELLHFTTGTLLGSPLQLQTKMSYRWQWPFVLEPVIVTVTGTHNFVSGFLKFIQNASSLVWYPRTQSECCWGEWAGWQLTWHSSTRNFWNSSRVIPSLLWVLAYSRKIS